MKILTANPVEIRGKKRWRVLIPPDLREGKGARYFSTKAAATAFVSDLNHMRGGFRSRFVSFPEEVQRQLVEAGIAMGGDVLRIMEAVDAWRSRTINQPKATKLVAEAVSDCIEAKEVAGMSAAYLREIKSTMGGFAMFAAGRSVHEITIADVSAWLASGDWAAATRRTYLTDIRTLFSFCVKREWCANNPAEKVERPALDERAPGILTVAQAETLLQTAIKSDRGIATYLAVGLFAGLRPSEALRFKLADAANGHIEVFASKTRSRRRRLVEIQPALRRVLALAAEVNPVNFTRRLRRVRLTAGVPWPHDVLRHSFASYHLSAFTSAEKTALELGHTETGTLFRHYRELVTRVDADQFWSLLPDAKNNLASPTTDPTLSP